MGRQVVALSALALAAAIATSSAQGQRGVNPTADSARRLDSVATALKVFDRPTRETRQRAVRLWTEAAGLYARAGDRRREGDMLTQAGRLHPSRDTAAVYLQSALQIARDLRDAAGEGRALLWLGVMQVRVGQNDSALVTTREAVRIARQVGEQWGESRAWSFYWVGHVYRELGQLDSAEAYYREAVRVARETGARTPEAGSLGDIGGINFQRGRYDSALVYHSAALRGFRAVGHRQFEAVWLLNIGAVHADLGRPDSALVYYNQAVVVAREAGHKAAEQVLEINIGLIHLARGGADSAITYFRRSTALARELGDSGSVGVALANLGEAQHAAGQSDSALANLRASLVLLREAGLAYPQPGTLGALGDVHAKAGRGDSALAAYRDGLSVARSAQSRAAEALLLVQLGDLHARGFSKPELARSVAYYDSAAAVRAVIASTAGEDQNRVSFGERSGDLFDRWTLAWLARAEEVGQEQSALAALAVAERGRAQALLDLLRRGQTRDSVDAAPRDGQTAQRAGADLVEEGRELAKAVQAMGAPTVAYMATKDTLLTWLILPTGEVTLERQAVARDSVAQFVAAIRRHLGADEAIGRTLRSIESSAERARPISPVTHEPPSGRTRTSAERFAASASALVPAALAGRLPRGGELVIVPHGPLALVAFAALPMAADPSRGLSAEPLGARYAIRYAPSLTTLRVVSARPGAVGEGEGGRRGTAARRALVVANPAMPRVPVARGGSVRLPPLPAAGREGLWVAQALGAESLTGSAATERAVRARMGGAAVIHLATHGFAYSSDAKALDSFVALAPDSAAGTATNGLLTVGEVIDEVPRLTADLVVLSACQTGLGNLRQAEGTVGLQRAFLAKGARSVLVSLWSVSDAATELLMRRFYTHWLRDADRPAKAEALRRAQADVRGTPGFASPRYWAAFQLVGAQ